MRWTILAAAVAAGGCDSGGAPVDLARDPAEVATYDGGEGAGGGDSRISDPPVGEDGRGGCGCDMEALEARVAALEEDEPGLTYWRTESSEVPADGDCAGQSLAAFCAPGDVVLSGSCMGTAALYFAGGPILRDGAYGWECYQPDDLGSCGVAVTALCDPR